VSANDAAPSWHAKLALQRRVRGVLHLRCLAAARGIHADDLTRSRIAALPSLAHVPFIASTHWPVSAACTAGCSPLLRPSRCLPRRALRHRRRRPWRACDGTWLRVREQRCARAASGRRPKVRRREKQLAGETCARGVCGRCGRWWWWDRPERAPGSPPLSAAASQRVRRRAAPAPRHAAAVRQQASRLLLRLRHARRAAGAGATSLFASCTARASLNAAHVWTSFSACSARCQAQHEP
jgi:hypothetical protein